MASGPQLPKEAQREAVAPFAPPCGSVPTLIQPDLSSYATRKQCPWNPFLQLS